MDIKTIGAVLGIGSALAGAVGGYAVLQYRVDELETAQAERVQAERAVLLLICEIHNVKPCPVVSQ